MKKINTLKIITLAAVLSCGAKAQASDFDLAGLSAADVRSSQAGIEIKAPAAQVDTDDLIGIDMSVRIPFKTLKKAVGMMAASDKDLTIIDPSVQVVSKAGEFLKISNLRVDVGGIIVEPTLTLKPYMEGRDKLAIRIQRVQLHASMAPDAASSAALPIGNPTRADNSQSFNQEDMMAQVMGVMIKSVYSSIDAKLKGEHPAIKAEDILTMKYDKAAWTLHAAFSSKVLHQFLPEGLVGDIHLTGFTFSDTGITMKVQTAQ
jgi:hypothetical protein